jgi:hypothetical protein
MHKSYTKNGFIVRGSEDVHYDDEGEIFVNEDKVIEYYYDEDIEEAEFPEDPEKEHYTFNGWFDSETGGEEITSYTGENDIEIGKAEGLALHLNGIDLPTHIYQNYDVNELLAIIDDSLEGNGERLSHWEGERFTSIYYYGKSYAIMKDIISEVTNNHPLCQNCVFEQIA